MSAMVSFNDIRALREAVSYQLSAISFGFSPAAWCKLHPIHIVEAISYQLLAFSHGNWPEARFNLHPIHFVEAFSFQLSAFSHQLLAFHYSLMLKADG